MCVHLRGFVLCRQQHMVSQRVSDRRFPHTAGLPQQTECYPRRQVETWPKKLRSTIT